MTVRIKKSLGYFIIAVVLIGLGKQCHREAPVSGSSYTESDLWNRPNMTMDGDEGINPADAEPTEYDLMQEDPDLHDFIAD